MFLCYAVAACFSVWEKQHTASIFRVIEVVQVGAEVIWRKKCVVCVGQFEDVWASHS
jgi:hypothetical protein